MSKPDAPTPSETSRDVTDSTVEVQHEATVETSGVDGGGGEAGRDASEPTVDALSGPAAKVETAKRPRLDWKPGMVVAGRYLIRRNVGVGGTGLVVVADDLLLRKPVAVKALRPSVAKDPENVQRFRKEVALCHAITHPNIARTYDLGEDNGIHYFSMEYLEGVPLSIRLRRETKLPASEVRAIAIPICEALHAAHEALVVHRDLKPSNIMLVPDSRRAMVMDFGISGLVHETAPAPAGAGAEGSGRAEDTRPTHVHGEWEVTSAGWGTPKYMSPEQWVGKSCGPSSDVYSLGAILFQCLTGRPPFDEADDRAFADAHVKREAPKLRLVDPELPRDLERIVARCLEKDPQQRYQSAADLADDLAGKVNVPPWVRFLGRAAGAALVMAIVGWGVLNVANRAIIREMRPAVERLAVLTAQSIDVADLGAIDEAEDYTLPEFERIRGYFLQVAEDNPEAHYIYILRALEEPGMWEFVVDKDPFAEDDNQNGTIEADEQAALPGMVYDGRHLPAMTAALTGGRPTADRDFVLDTYGLYLSGYAPLGDNRGPGGYVLGVDVTNERLRLFNRVVIGVCVVGWFLLTVGPRLFALLRRRRRSVQAAPAAP